LLKDKKVVKRQAQTQNFKETLKQSRAVKVERTLRLAEQVQLEVGISKAREQQSVPTGDVTHRSAFTEYRVRVDECNTALEEARLKRERELRSMIRVIIGGVCGNFDLIMENQEVCCMPSCMLLVMCPPGVSDNRLYLTTVCIYPICPQAVCHLYAAVSPQTYETPNKNMQKAKKVKITAWNEAVKSFTKQLVLLRHGSWVFTRHAMILQPESEHSKKCTMQYCSLLNALATVPGSADIRGLNNTSNLREVAKLGQQLYYLHNLALRSYGTNEIYEEWGTDKQLAAGADNKRSHFQQFLFDLLFPVKASDPITCSSQLNQFEGVYACTQLALGTIPEDQFKHLVEKKIGLKQQWRVKALWSIMSVVHPAVPTSIAMSRCPIVIVVLSLPLLPLPAPPTPCTATCVPSLLMTLQRNGLLPPRLLWCSIWLSLCAPLAP
jgi:hypothetical protein